MYTLINQNIHRLLGEIDCESEVRPYVWLTCNLHNRNVSNDEEYQRKYSYYWALNGAGLGKEFRDAYFCKLEELKQNSKTDDKTVEAVARWLWEAPVNRSGRRSLQFSFASKLVHMINPDLPLYDSRVEDFYFLPPTSASEKLEAKMESYRFLVEEYNRVLADGILSSSIQKFRDKFDPDSACYSDIKVIDTLIWKFATVLRNGAMQNRVVVYQ